MWKAFFLNVLVSFPVWASLKTPKELSQSAEYYPNKDLTTGAIFKDITAIDVCMSGYAKSVRNVSVEMKVKVKVSYGIAEADYDLYTIDHLIPLCLGGTNDPSNLWPQKKDGPYSMKDKSLTETNLYRKVCKGEITLQHAQKRLFKDWIAAYKDCCEDKPSRKDRKKKKHKKDPSMRRMSVEMDDYSSFNNMIY